MICVYPQECVDLFRHIKLSYIIMLQDEFLFWKMTVVMHFWILWKAKDLHFYEKWLIFSSLCFWVMSWNSHIFHWVLAFNIERVPRFLFQHSHVNQIRLQFRHFMEEKRVLQSGIFRFLQSCRAIIIVITTMVTKSALFSVSACRFV